MCLLKRQASISLQLLGSCAACCHDSQNITGESSAGGILSCLHSTWCAGACTLAKAVIRLSGTCCSTLAGELCSSSLAKVTTAKLLKHASCSGVLLAHELAQMVAGKEGVAVGWVRCKREPSKMAEGDELILVHA